MKANEVVFHETADGRYWVIVDGRPWPALIDGKDIVYERQNYASRLELRLTFTIHVGMYRVDRYVAPRPASEWDK